MRPSLVRNTTFAAALCACLFSGSGFAAGLTDLLVSKVGVTPVQAEGGAGSIFKLAKSQLTADKFARIRTAVPGMDKYLAAAPALPQPATAAPATAASAAGAAAATPATGSLAGAAAKALGNSGQLGAMGGKLATLQQLAPAFEALGMKGKLVAKFVPVVTEYVQSTGGASAAKLLTGALGF